MRAQFVLSEIGIGLRRNLTMTVAVVVTVAISLALFGSALLIRKQVEAMKDFWYDKVEVSVYLCGESSDTASCGGSAVTDQQRSELQADLEAIRGKVRLPVAVKPIQSHKFTAVFGKKLFIVEDDLDELGSKVRHAWEHGIDVFVVEMIPGPDSQLSSYYTYRTGDGRSDGLPIRQLTHDWARPFGARGDAPASHQPEDQPAAS